MKRNRVLIAVSLLLALTMVLTGCTPATTTTTVPATAVPKATVVPVDWSKMTSAQEGGGMEALIAAAQAEGELNVITLPDNWCAYGEMMANFSKKYGIKVNSLNPDGGSADEIQAIIDNKDNKGPQAPDVIDVGPAYGPLAKEQGLVTPYKVATWDTIVGQKDPDGYFFIDYNGVLAFEINTDVVKNVPLDWADLLKPEYKGQIGLPGDPRASNEAAQSVYAAALANGGSLDNIQPGLDFMKQLVTNGNLLPLIADAGVIAKGEVPISIHWNYLALANKDVFKGNPEITVVYPKSVIWGGYYYQAISAYAPHPAAARLWEEYLYSDEGQLTWIKGYCTPARMADLVSKNLVSDAAKAALPPAEMLAKAIVPSPDQLKTARAFIKDQWDSVVGLDIKTGN